MASFSVRFLGCKVSHVDAHDVRERLLADGHTERDDGADVAVVNTCCVTHEAVSKSRKEAARAARTHRRVYVTGCGANLAADAFAGLPDNVVVVARRSEETPGYVAGDVGAIGCVQADARLDRVRAFVKVQDGCSFSCAFCVIPLVRGASRSRGADRRARRDPPPRRAGPPRGRADRDQPRLLPRPRGRLRPAAPRARGGSDARARAAPPLLDRDQPRERRADRRAARDADGEPAPARAAPVRRRRSPPRDGPPLHASPRTSAGSRRCRTSST